LHAAGGAGRIGRVVADRTPGVAEIAAEIGTGPAIGVERLVHGVGRASVVEVGGVGRHRPSRGDQRERAFGWFANASLHATAANRGPAWKTPASMVAEFRYSSRRFIESFKLKGC